MSRGFWNLSPKDRLLLILRRDKRGWGGRLGIGPQISKVIQKIRDWPDDESIPSLTLEELGIVQEAEQRILELGGAGEEELRPREEAYYREWPGFPKGCVD